MVSSPYGLSMLVMQQLSEISTVVEFQIQSAFWGWLEKTEYELSTGNNSSGLSLLQE